MRQSPGNRHHVMPPVDLSRATLHHIICKILAATDASRVYLPYITNCAYLDVTSQVRGKSNSFETTTLPFPENLFVSGRPPDHRPTGRQSQVLLHPPGTFSSNHERAVCEPDRRTQRVTTARRPGSPQARLRGSLTVSRKMAFQGRHMRGFLSLSDPVCEQPG